MKHRSASGRTLAKSLAGVFVALGLFGVAAMAVAPSARANEFAYLVNVHMRPGYNFPNADAALSYGYGICDKESAGTPFGQLMADVRADFNPYDDYHAMYLINQAVNELCPALIWQLRKSAEHYQSPPGVTP
jgi:hypothetical protein